MDSIWSEFGFNVVSIWIQYGFNFEYGIKMESIWNQCQFNEGSMWIPHGFNVDSIWVECGFKGFYMDSIGIQSGL